MRWLCCLALGLVFCCVVHADARAERRVALVIGNGAYINAPHLPNPLHDADDVAAALKRVGFDVIRGADLDKAAMQDAVVRFARAAQSADVGIFYYSGHALQFNGVNYLMPVDAKLDDEADLYRFTRVDDVLGYLQQVKTLKVLVLDSCRNNPLAEGLKRSVGLTRAATIQRGLARIEAPTGTIISYSTQAGRIAADGTGRNSPYTAAFLKHIEEPSEIGDIFRDVSADVYHATGETQLPELSLSIIGKYYFRGLVSTTANPPPPDPCAAAGDHWQRAESIATAAAFQDHLARFPACPFAERARARIDALKSKQAVVVPPTKLPRTQETATPAMAPKPAAPAVNPCGSAPAVSVSLSPRPAKPLTAVEECGLKPKEVFRECDKCPEMVVVPGGSFHMGHREVGSEVTLAKPFAAGKFHITLAQFTAFAAETGYDAKPCGDDGQSWRRPGFTQTVTHPVVCVSWNDATAYAAWLSKKTGKAYRLLTEAEWEYAARAGTATDWFWGKNVNDAKAYAHCADCNDSAAAPANGAMPSRTVAVGSLKPNPFGLYDMAGNAEQWVLDCYHEGYEGAPADGSARPDGDCSYRMTRGGSWATFSSGVRSFDHSYAKSDEANWHNGFRIGRTLGP